MIPLHPEDLVRLTHSPTWTATVLCTEGDEAFVYHGGWDCSWIPVDVLELVPGANIEMWVA